jgi:hypothetical protein
MDTASGLDYLVNYSGPSWNNQYGANERRPGWLGVHRLSGRIASGASSYKFDFDEQTEITEDAVGTGNSYTYDGNVNVYADPTSPANVQKAESSLGGWQLRFRCLYGPEHSRRVGRQPRESGGDRRFHRHLGRRRDR